MSDTHLSHEELETQIEAQREQIADTVDQLSQKLDVKAQVRARLSRIRPEAVAGFVGAAILVGGLVWWRKRQ